MGNFSSLNKAIKKTWELVKFYRKILVEMGDLSTLSTFLTHLYDFGNFVKILPQPLIMKLGNFSWSLFWVQSEFGYQKVSGCKRMLDTKKCWIPKNVGYLKFFYRFKIVCTKKFTIRFRSNKISGLKMIWTQNLWGPITVLVKKILGLIKIWGL